MTVDIPVTSGLAPRFKFQDFTYVSERARLIMSPEDVSDARMNGVEQHARRVLQLLLYTPVTGIGFNFEFVDEHPGNDVLQNFNTVGADIIAHAPEEVQVTERTANLSFSRPQLGVVNINTSFDGNKVKVNFNFHYALTHAADLANLPQGRFIADRNYASVLMEAIYGLEQEEQE